MPPEMANNDAAGAEAAVGYFVDLYGYTKLSRDLSSWIEVVDSDCVFCASVTQSVEELVAEDRSQVGGLLRLEKIVLISEPSESDTYLFDTVVRQEPFEIRSGEGASIESYGESVTTGRFAVSYIDGRWRLLAAGTHSSEE